MTNPLADNVNLQLQIFACNPEELERLGLLSAEEATYRTQIMPTTGRQLKAIRQASRSRNWEAIAFPTVTTPSGVPQAYSQTVKEILTAGNANYRIDLIPMVLGDGQLRLELRTEVSQIVTNQQGDSITGIHPPLADIAEGVNDDESLVLACKTQSEGDTIGFVTIVTPTWATSGVKHRVAQRRH